MRLRLAAGAALLTTLIAGAGAGQEAPPPDGLVAALPWRAIGPTNMGGRVTDIAVQDDRPQVFYVGLATGGIYKTENHGTTFTPVFDRAGMSSIGDVAIAPSDPQQIWAGTGEPNSRNSVSWGNGVWRSTDGGKTWTHAGLEATHHIGRIVVHPTDSKIAYVAALGRTWGPSAERGLYKTVDGGTSWRKVLFVDADTGVVDVILHPRDPEVVFAASYHRRRDEFDVNDPAERWGPGSALWKSTDGGANWNRLSGPGEHRGLPTVLMGRCGLDICRTQPDTWFAVVETELIGQALEGHTEPPLKGPAYMGVNGETAPDKGGARMTQVMPFTGAAKAGLKAGDVITEADGKPITSWDDMVAVIRSKRAGHTIDIVWTRDGATQRGKLRFGARGRSADPKRMFMGPLGGQTGGMEQYQGPKGFEQGGVYRSDDAGRSWRRVSSLNPRPFYFSQIRVNPANPDDFWIHGIQLHRTLDGGKSWNNRAGGSTHVDYHAMWIDPRDPDHVLMGSDGGCFATWDGGKVWDHLCTFEAGQFYKVSLDNRVPFHCYGGLQDNGTWGGPSRSRASTGATQADWQLLQWGDGFGAAIHPSDDGIVFATSQNGRIRKHNLRTGKSQNLARPRGMKLRFNWNTPFVISPHDPKVLWVGASRLLRIPDGGVQLEAVSPEFTRTDRGSATVVAEDPLRPGRIYIGTDDGALRVSSDNGKRFQPRFAALPGVAGPRYVSAIEPSRHQAGRVYVSLDGHRSDDFRPYVFVSEDAGTTWRAIAANLPAGVPVRVVREDPRVPGLLYAGTETGVWVSRSNGERWEPLGTGLPVVPVFDLAIHPRDRELVAATHGRSLWIVNVAPLQDAQSSDAGPDQIRWLGAHPVVLLDREPRGRLAGRRHFTVANPPASDVQLWLPVTPKAGLELAIEVQDAEGKPVANLMPDPKRAPLTRGYNRITWDCDRWGRRGNRWLRPVGKVKPATYTYVVRIKDQILATAEVEVQADPGPDPGLVRIPAAGRFHEWLAKKQQQGGWKGH